MSVDVRGGTRSGRSEASPEPRKQRRFSLPIVAGVVLLAAAAVGGVLWATGRSHGPTAGTPSAVSVPPGMHVVFSSDFPGTSLDTTKWSTCYPWASTGAGCTNFANPELQWYLPSQDQVSGGALHLVAQRLPTQGQAANGSPMSYDWRSGLVTTFNSAAFTYGYVQVTARLVRGDGMWSALWLLPQSQPSPPEIDIAEVSGEDPSQLSVVLHGTASHPFRTFHTSDLSQGWHTFGLDWEPSSLTWYVDGSRVYRYAGSNVPNTPMFFLANLAVGNFPTSHPTSSTPSPASLDIRSVSVYQH